MLDLNIEVKNYPLKRFSSRLLAVTVSSAECDVCRPVDSGPVHLPGPEAAHQIAELNVFFTQCLGT